MIYLYKERKWRRGRCTTSMLYNLLVIREEKYLFPVSRIKRIAALRTEPGRISGILGLPTTFVAGILRFCIRFFCATFRAEFALVDTAALTGPTLRTAAFGTEFSGVHCAAFTGPSLCRRCSGNRSGLLLPHLVQLCCIETAGSLGHIHTHASHHGSVFVGSSGFHGFCLGLNHVCCCHIGITEHGRLLQFLNGGFILFGGSDGVDTNGNHAQTPQAAPFCGQYLSAISMV